MLTCNDTLIFDPFNFQVPETSSNTRNRIFGPAEGILTPISSRQFASGRFLIFATASGTSEDADDNAEIRFPFEFSGTFNSSTYAHCDNLHFTDEDDEPTLTGSFYGSAGGISSFNLHVFNANAVAFNYLIGAQTFAELVSGAGDTPIAQAWGLNAWTRPAVDGYLDLMGEEANAPAGGSDQFLWELGLGNFEDSPNRRGDRRHPDGDGFPLLADNDWRILGGGEKMFQSDGDSLLNWNVLILRAETHGGDTARIGVPDLPLRENNVAGAGFRQRQGGRTDSLGFGPIPATEGDEFRRDFSSWWGALGTPSIFGVDPEDQIICFLSIMDDYNGSGTSFGGLFANDNSYNVAPAETTYVLQIFDQDELLYDVSPDPDPNISPFPEQARVTLKITVDCLRVWLTDFKVPSTSVEDLEIAELQGITTENGGPVGWLTKPINPIIDASQGWIRFVRDNTQDGTWESYRFGPGDDADSDANMYGVFVTIAFQTIVQGGLGSAWWLAAVASDPWVSATGSPSCSTGGTTEHCPNGAGRDHDHKSPWLHSQP